MKIFSFLLLFLVSLAAAAQDYPNRPIRVIVPYAAGGPPDIVAKLSAQAARAVKQPDVAARFKQLGIDPVGSTPEALAAQNRVNYEKYARVVKASGAKID